MSDPQDTPQAVPWPDAAAVVLRRVASLRAARSLVIVGITGPVGSGKSSLAARLGGTVISSDSYLPDYAQVEFHQRDDPQHADLPLLASHLSDLRAGRSASVPVWSFHSHRRESHTVVHPEPFLVCEGIHALHPTVRPHIDLAVFVDAPAHIRWARWESLERSGTRGWGVEHARKHFQQVAEPAFARWAPQYRSAANLLVINDL